MMYPKRPTKPTPIEDVSAGSLIIREGAIWRVESNEPTLGRSAYRMPSRSAYRTLTLRGGRAGTQKGSRIIAPTGSIVTVCTN